MRDFMDDYEDFDYEDMDDYLLEMWGSCEFDEEDEKISKNVKIVKDMKNVLKMLKIIKMDMLHFVILFQMHMAQ